MSGIAAGADPGLHSESGWVQKNSFLVSIQLCTAGSKLGYDRSGWDHDLVV